MYKYIFALAIFTQACSTSQRLNSCHEVGRNPSNSTCPSSLFPGSSPTGANSAQIVRRYSSYSNISQPPIASPSVGQDPLPKNFSYHVFNRLSGKVQELDSEGKVTSEYNSWEEFCSRFHLNDTYFPFILDAEHPNQMIFGLGESARLRDGSNVRGTLVRNGGHYQLSSRYRESDAPDVAGLFGGGLKLNGGVKPEIEFQSRSVNQTSNGRLPHELLQNLKIEAESFFGSDP